MNRPFVEPMHERQPVALDGEDGREIQQPILLQYWNSLVRWKWVVIGIVVAALATGLIATLLMTPQYTAETRLEISREEPNITSVEGLENAQTGQDDEFYQTQYSNLRARSLALRIVRGLELASNEAFFAAHAVDLEAIAEARESTLAAGTLEAGRDEREFRENLAVDLLLEHVEIAPITRSRLVDIRYTSASPDYSAIIANRWASEFITASSDRRFASTSDAREFLEGRLAELAARLEESERRAVNYAAANDIVALGNSVTPDGRSLVDRTLASTDLEALNSSLAQATADRIAAESRLQGSGADTSEVTNPTITSLRQTLAQAEAEYARLMSQFKADYPPAVALQSQIADLRTSIAQEQNRIRTSRANEYRQAASRESDLRQQVSGLKSQLSTQNAASIQYNIYRREADTNRQLYDSLLQRYKEIGVAGVAVNNITIIDTAEVPNTPSAPDPFLNLALALIAGIGLAFGALVVLEQIDEGLRDPSDVRKVLGIPLLGTVPSIEHDDLVAELEDRKSELSEAYFNVKSNLAFVTEHGFPKSLLVTSTRPAEGKSTTSVALAQSLARTSERVLLLDGDLRSPSCHKILGLRNERGLSNYLAGEEDWQVLLQQAPGNGLDFISTGPPPPSAAELLSTDRMANLLRELKASYDHVIVDASPLLGLADVPLLARVVEGCVFVVETNGVSQRSLKASLDRLRQANARLFGAVMTKYETRSTGYGNDYGYSYGYGDRDS
ncbi:MAG: polysaccharide biosynthesis tyrosine autokinase [Erythrobacter sp.]